HAICPNGPLMAHRLSFDLEALLVLWSLSSTVPISDLHSKLQEGVLWILTLKNGDNVAGVDLSVQSRISLSAVCAKLNIVNPDTAARRSRDYGVDAWDRHPIIA